MTIQYIAPTKRKKVSQKEAARLFLLHNGICCNCGLQININAGEKYFIEHPDALILGGPNDDINRKPSHLTCKKPKDAADAAARSERDRHVTKTWVREPDSRSKPKWPSQRLGHGNHQKTASRPFQRKERTPA